MHQSCCARLRAMLACVTERARVRRRRRARRHAVGGIWKSEHRLKSEKEKKASSGIVALALRKFFSTLLKTPFKAASKLGNKFLEPKTAFHTCSRCSHNQFLQLQHKSTPALHRISHGLFTTVLEAEIGR
jgi:hypothetical protein